MEISFLMAFILVGNVKIHRNFATRFLIPSLNIRKMKNSITLGALLMSLAIVLGAFAAHGLKNILDEHSIEIFNKGVYYQVIHSFGILFSALLLKDSVSLRRVTILFLAGIICFSGSLYLLAFSTYLNEVVEKIAGPITPIGGLFFVASWLALARAYRKLEIN